MSSWRGVLQNAADLNQTHTVPASYVAGHAIGIIAVELVYPKLPGNVVNATTYPFPVLYQRVRFDIERLFRGDPGIADEIVAAAVELEAQGVRAIIGACGYFAHFQEQVKAAVKVPVFLSSLCQVPLIRLGLQQDQKIAVLVASAEHVTGDLLRRTGADLDACLIHDIGSLDSFAPIRWGRTELDNDRLTRDLAESARALVARRPEIGAVLLECSDLPPYASEIQRATGLPVFDFISLIHWVYHGVVQKRYLGYF